MKISTHQSSFFPWAGFWWRVLNSDIFVVMEDADFSTSSMYYRTWMPKPPQMIKLDYWTVPINRKELIKGAKIKDVKIAYDKETVQRKMFEQSKLYANMYKKRFIVRSDFNKVKNRFLELFENPDNFNSLVDLNKNCFWFVFNELKLNTQISFSTNEFETAFVTEENTDETKSKRLALFLSRYLKNELKEEAVYISGMSGKNYLVEDIFCDVFKGKVVYQEKTDLAIPNSILHLLFTCEQENLQNELNRMFVVK